VHDRVAKRASFTCIPPASDAMFGDLFGRAESESKQINHRRYCESVGGLNLLFFDLMGLIGDLVWREI
jgi:hypothetical protein